MYIHKKHMVLIIILLLFCVFNALPNVGEFDLYEYVYAMLGLGRIQICSGGMFLLVSAMFPIIVVELIEGISIYKHYTDGSVYYFVRQKNLKKWYDNEAKKLFLTIFEVYFLYLILGYVIGCIMFGELPDVSSMCAVLCQCMMFTLFTFAFSLIINCLSVVYGTDIAYVFGICIQLVFVLLLMIFDKREVTVDNQWILRWNPIACISIIWHYIPKVNNGDINMIKVEFDALVSCVYLAIIDLLVYVLGRRVLSNKDIALENKEEQG